MADAYGPWAPLTIARVASALADAPVRWWVTGGFALELHLHRSWREHDDIDIGIRRQDAPALFAHLRDWAPSIVANGQLAPWDGRPLVEADAENNVWWRREPDGPWVLDTAIGDGDDHGWIYRRDPSVRRPWDQAVLRSPTGVPYLAPELQLLFKAKDVRPKDQLDAEVVIPELESERRAVLAAALPSDHVWRSLLGEAPRPPSRPTGGRRCP